MIADPIALHPNDRGWSRNDDLFVQERAGGAAIASCWRSTDERRKWVVCAHEGAFGLVAPSESIRCVMDDFGSLRRVS